MAKEHAAADFAITQVFFDAPTYCALLTRAHDAGTRMPIVPGFVPATNAKRLVRLAELSGVGAPRELLHALEIAADDAESRRIGVRFTVALASRILDAGAPGLHLFTFNSHADALDVLDDLDLDRWSTGLDADVTSIESARSCGEILGAIDPDAFPRGIGPGAWDIHSPRVPSAEEIAEKLRRARAVVGLQRLRVNPDCGLKTGGYVETAVPAGI